MGLIMYICICIFKLALVPACQLASSGTRQHKATRGRRRAPTQVSARRTTPAAATAAATAAAANARAATTSLTPHLRPPTPDDDCGSLGNYTCQLLVALEGTEECE